jgi:hypothetical protein
VQREPAIATVRSPSPVSDADIVHPWLSRVGGMFGHWLGREVLHGGAFTGGDGAWVVLGGRPAGKSTLLAGLAGAGHEVLADDALVIEDGMLFAGPRCIDLRPDAGKALGASRARTARDGSRWRLDLPPAPAAVPLAGIVHLGWDRAPDVRPVEVARRIELLRAAAWLGPHDPIAQETLLDFAALPTVELVRPRTLDAAGEALGRLRAVVGA